MKNAKKWRLNNISVLGGASAWDRGVAEASEIYSHRIHNLFCDNCHSHVARALNLMFYERKSDWNMVVLCFMVFFKAKFVGYIF